MKYSILSLFLFGCVKTSVIPPDHRFSSVPPPTANTFLLTVVGLSPKPYTVYAFSNTTDGTTYYYSDTLSDKPSNYPATFIKRRDAGFDHPFYTLVFRASGVDLELGVLTLTNSRTYNNSPDVRGPNNLTLPSPDPGMFTQVGINLAIAASTTEGNNIEYSGSVTGTGVINGNLVTYNCRFTNALLIP